MAAERVRGEGVNRRLSTEGPRCHGIRVWLSGAENAELRRRATQGKVSLSRYLVEAALDRPSTPAERRVRKAQLYHLERLIAGLAASVDQLARETQSTGQAPTGADGALEDLHGLRLAAEALAVAAGYDGERTS